jgi:hypothetical protein
LRHLVAHLSLLLLLLWLYTVGAAKYRSMLLLLPPL